MEQISFNKKPKTTSETSHRDVYQQVTDTIMRQLESGTIPWQKSWNDNSSAFILPENFVTGNKYRGINIVLLWCASQEKKFLSNEWASFRQWQSKKETIRKGEKGNLIVYADTFEKEVEGEIQKVPFLKHSVVFNRCQLAGYNSTAIEAFEPKGNLVERIDALDEFISNSMVEIIPREGGAAYNPTTDQIYMPFQSSFIDTTKCTATENYYSVLLHELTHWTGHPTRMNRQIKNKFGNHAYAEEELIAELGAAFLASDFEISSPEKLNHAAYIGNWLKVLKDNKYFIVSAASEASKATDYLRKLQPA